MLKSSALGSEKKGFLQDASCVNLLQHIDIALFRFDPSCKSLEYLAGKLSNLWPDNTAILSLDSFLQLVKESQRNLVAGYLTGTLAVKKNVQLQIRLSNRTSLNLLLSMAAENEEGLFLLQPDLDHAIRLQQQLDEQGDVTQQAIKDLDEFAYTASHDLHEPLRKLSTYTERLVAKIPESSDLQAYTSRIQDATTRMRAYIDELLSFSRVSTKQLIFNSIDLNELLAEIVNSDLKKELTEKEAIVNMGLLPIIQGDRGQIKQLFTNVINNAVKFSDPVRQLSIDIKSDLASDTEIGENQPGKGVYYKITVTDNGIGFQQEFAEKIFKLFSRLNSKHEYGGTGIGLAICRRISSNHNGFITATGKLNEGSTFIIVLPQKQQDNE